MITSNLLPPTAEDTVGPYYPMAFCAEDRADLVVPDPGLVFRAAGTPVLLSGQVLDVHGHAVAPLLMEFWQADAAGCWRSPLDMASGDPHFSGYARQYVDAEHYHLRTVKPGAVPAQQGQAARAPHITVTIFCDGLSRVVTQLFFADEPGNDADPLLASLPPDLRSRLIAQPAGQAGDALVYHRDIVLRGPNETPFFDDLES